MQIVADLETPAQLQERESGNYGRTNLPVNEHFASSSNCITYPGDHTIKVWPQVFLGDVTNIQNIVLKTLRMDRLQPSHGLDNVCNASLFESAEVARSIDISNVQLR